MATNGPILTPNASCKRLYTICVTGTTRSWSGSSRRISFHKESDLSVSFRENYDLRLCQHLRQRVRLESDNEIEQTRVSDRELRTDDNHSNP